MEPRISGGCTLEEGHGLLAPRLALPLVSAHASEFQALSATWKVSGLHCHMVCLCMRTSQSTEHFPDFYPFEPCSKLGGRQEQHYF
jgi:hypothetical protein